MVRLVVMDVVSVMMRVFVHVFVIRCGVERLVKYRIVLTTAQNTVHVLVARANVKRDIAA